MTSKIEIVRRAASRTGNGQITSLDDNDDVAQIVEDHYEDIVQTMLTQHGWKFARRASEINQLSATVEPPWTALWNAPTGMLALQYVTDTCAQTVDHEQRDAPSGPAIAIEGDYDTLYAVYTYRVSEDRFPADFARAVQQHLEAAMLAGINEQRDQADRREKRADTTEQRARIRDQRSSSATDANESDLTLARDRRTRWPYRRA